MKRIGWVLTMYGGLLICSAATVGSEFDYYATSSSDEPLEFPTVYIEDEQAEDQEFDYIEATYGGVDDALAQDDCGKSDDDWTCCCQPRWTARADAMYLYRNIASSRVLFTDNFAAGAPSLSLDDLDFNFSWGYRLGLTRHIDRCRSLEVSFFSLDSWTTGKAVAGAPFQFAMNNLYGVNFGDLDSLRATYGSDLHSVEANLRQKRCDRLTWLAGFRYVELDELFSIVDTFGFGTEMFDVRTRNYLYGGQLGADIKVLDRGCFDVNVMGKGGLYYVRAKEFSAYSFFGTSGFDSQSDVAFLGELTITGTYQLRPGLAVRGGYQMAWLDGVALASEQLDSTSLTPPPNVSVDTDGGIFYHGGFVGLELRR